MKYFLDTEFIEYPCTIDLISIGIKCEDNRTFYAENAYFDKEKASSWVKENVIPKLRWYGNMKLQKNSHGCIMCKKNATEVFGTLDFISKVILNFIGKDIPEFWGNYSSYDWVAFCWLFGPLVSLPKNWPMYCHDLKQLADDYDNPKFPPPIGKHNALVDACWNEKFYYYLCHMRSK